MVAMRKLLATLVLLWAPSVLAAWVYEPKLRLTLESRFDDDFRLSNTEPGGQLMTKVSPRLGLDVKDPTLTLESFYASDLLMRHGSGNVSLDHRGGLDVKKVLSRRLRVETTGSIFRVTDPTSLPRESVARSTEPVLYGQAKLTLIGRLSQRVDARGGYGVEGVRLLAVGQQAGFVHVPFLEVWWRATRRLSLGTEYRYQAFHFGDEFAQAHGAFAALRYRLTRQTTFTARTGPMAYVGQEGQGLVPRVALELAHESERFELGAVAGHDLVGASGFSNVVWADYAGLMVTGRFDSRLSAHGAASYFRNGQAPNEGAFSLGGSPLVVQGYALGLGVDFKVNRYVSLQGAVDRIAQVGAAEAAAGVELTRNVAAVRLHISTW
jgi:hypothetical protein